MPTCFRLRPCREVVRYHCPTVACCSHLLHIFLLKPRVHTVFLFVHDLAFVSRNSKHEIVNLRSNVIDCYVIIQPKYVGNSLPIISAVPFPISKCVAIWKQRKTWLFSCASDIRKDQIHIYNYKESLIKECTSTMWSQNHFENNINSSMTKGIASIKIYYVNKRTRWVVICTVHNTDALKGNMKSLHNIV